MKPIQIIAFDLDGTVLDSKKHLSDRNRNTLAACAKMGIYVVPTTGRSAAGIIPEIKGIPGVRNAITTNGGTITDLKTGQVGERQTLSNEKALRLLAGGAVLAAARAVVRAVFAHILYNFFLKKFG